MEGHAVLQLLIYYALKNTIPPPPQPLHLLPVLSFLYSLTWQLFQNMANLLDYLCYKEFLSGVRFTAKCIRKRQYCRHLQKEFCLFG